MNITTELRRLQGLSVNQLRAEFERVSGEAARSFNRVFLIKRIAWRLQATEQGGLSDRARELAMKLAREADLRVRPPDELHRAFAAMSIEPPRGRELPPPGSIITRVYKGRRVEVRVASDGTFEWHGQSFGSLSAVAKAITGADWNGRLFFGLSKRGGAA